MPPALTLGCAGTLRSFRWRWTSSHRVSAARTSRLPLTLPYAAAAPEPQRADWPKRPRLKHRSARHVHLTRVPAAGQDEDGSGSIDAEEFMSRASQYQSLSEKIGDGHTCRKGSLASMSAPSAAKPEKPPAAAPEGASRSKRSSRPAAAPLEEAPRSKSSSRPAAVPLEEAPHSRGSSHTTVTPGSTPPLGRDSSPVQRTAATTSTIRRESIVAGFTDADKEQAARLFAEYDDDGSGELDFDEFREARRRGQGPGVGLGEGRVADGLFARAEPWR